MSKQNRRETVVEDTNFVEKQEEFADARMEVVEGVFTGLIVGLAALVFASFFILI